MIPPKKNFLLVFLFLGVLAIVGCASAVNPKDLANSENTDTVSYPVPVISTNIEQSFSTRVPGRLGTPIARSHAAMIFDSKRGVMVLFGGTSDSAYLNDTWEYDGSQWYLVETSVSPPARVLHEMAYDPERATTILFGGEIKTEYDGTQYLHNTVYGDLWEYDGQKWRQIQAAEMPSPRTRFSMSYYPLEKAVFIVGGNDGGPTSTSGTNGDAWLYDGFFWPGGINNQGSRNDELMYHYFNLSNSEMIYDENRQQLIIMTGQRRYYTLEFDGKAWEAYQSVVVVNEDSERFLQQDYALCYDQHRGVSVLFGGLSAKAGAESFPLNDTWEYDGESWTKADPTNSPSPRSGHAMAYDEVRKVTVLFGGIDADGNRLNDTWEYDGTTWIQR